MSKRKTLKIEELPELPFEFADDEGPEEAGSDMSDAGAKTEAVEEPDFVFGTPPPRVPRAKDIFEKKLKSLPSGLPDKRLRYMSFGSGSSGNSCYIGTSSSGIIVDAGVRADIVEDSLAESGIKMDNVKGVLLTHDHSDHVRYVYTLLRNNKHLKLFCTNRVINAVLKRHNISKRLKDYHVPIFKEIPFKLCDFEVTAFEVPHDGSDNMGFSISYEGRNFVIATDMGAAHERAVHYISQANYLVVESNYDSRMLTLGPYPEYLKARIRTDNGHMDNEATAALLAQIASPRLSHIFLCHLSRDNNTPEIALEASRRALLSKGFTVGNCEETLTDRAADVQLMALPRFEPTRLIMLMPPREGLS